MEPNFKSIFSDSSDFDLHNPAEGHKERFLVKVKKSRRGTSMHLVYKISGIAAIFLIVLTVWLSNNTAQKGIELSKISPDFEEAQMHFTGIIENELNDLQIEDNDEFKPIIKSALNQLQTLEKEYETLKADLYENAGNEEITFFMISNFQKRIEILQELSIQLKKLKQLKNEVYEKSI